MMPTQMVADSSSETQNIMEERENLFNTILKNLAKKLGEPQAEGYRLGLALGEFSFFFGE